MKRLAVVLFSLAVFAGSSPAAETTLLSIPPAVPSHGDRGQLLGGDFNGDGVRDFLVMAYDGVLALHHGLGDGTFAPAVLTEAHYSRYDAAMAAADFDRDGLLDLAIHEYSNWYQRILLLYGRADGTFVKRGELPSEADEGTPQLGDFTGDGHVDIALPTGKYVYTSIWVHPGDGNGGFGVPIVTPVVLGWDFVSATDMGDVDGDGNLDLLIASSSQTYVSYGAGHGRFGRSATLDGGARSLAVADYNSDGRPDWIAAGHGQPHLRAWINQPDGTFALRELGGVAGPGRVVAADMNADGVPDLAVHAAGSHLAIFTSRDDGTFAPPRLFTPGRAVWTIDAGRFDGDATPDILAAGPARAAVVRGRGDGTLDAPESYRTGVGHGSRTFRVFLADVTGDGTPDAVTVRRNAEERLLLQVLPNDGHGRFGAPITTPTSLTDPDVWPDQFPILGADFTGDGRLDIAIPMPATGLHLFAGRGDGTFDAPVVTPGIPLVRHAADFDGDGLPDLAGVIGRADLVVYLNRGGGTFGQAIRTEGSYSNDVLGVVADFNGDGTLDLARNSAQVYLGTGDGRFVRTGDRWSSGLSALAGGDFDEDGVADVISQGYENDIFYFRGKGDGTFHAPSVIGFDRELEWRAQTIAADIDGDGHLDLAAAADPLYGDVPHVTILLGDGRGSFRALGSLLYGGGTESIAVADLDANGSLDLAVADKWSGALDVFRTYIAPPLGVPATVTVEAPETATHGQRFAAKVAVSSASRYLYEGAVILRDGDRVLAIRHPEAGGKAAFELMLPAGMSDFTAALAEDRLFTAAPAMRRIHVEKARLRLDIVVDDPTFAGKPVTFGYRYRVEGDGYLAWPTGPLTLTVDGLHQETFDLPGHGKFSVHPKRYGAFTITAEYAGDANHHPARVTRTVVLTPPVGDVALLVEPGRRVAAGTPVTLRAVVAPSTSGSVMFFDRDDFLGTAPVTNGAAKLTTDTLPRGTHLVYAVFSGDEHAGPARSTAVYVTVEGPPLPKRRRVVGTR